MKTIFLRISNTAIYFNDSDFIKIENTNIPYENLKFNTEHKEVFWEVELVEFVKTREELFVIVNDYSPQNVDSFRDQKCKYPFNRIKFDLLDWDQVEPQLSNYQESAIKEHFKGIPDRQAQKSKDHTWSDPEFVKQKLREIDSAKYSTKISVKEVLRIALNDFQFQDGFASTLKELKNPGVEIRIVIHNSTFRKEFEYIKEYFIKYLGRKTVKVVAEIEYDVDTHKITNEKYNCPELQGIDETVIEAIKIRRTNILKKPSQKEMKSILDLEELFHLMNDRSAGINVFQQTEDEIISHFITIEGIRNKQHLSFLTKDLHQRNVKIRFTIHPIFGFVFSYKTNGYSYFIWELLDSHATYVWYMENTTLSTISLYSEFEKAIEYIRALGRDDYKSAYKEGKINENIQFQTISHNRTDISGLEKWKEKLNTIIK